MARQYRCTQCRTENSYSWTVSEVHQKYGTRGSPRKTETVPCSSCGERTVQNELGR